MAQLTQLGLQLVVLRCGNVLPRDAKLPAEPAPQALDAATQYAKMCELVRQFDPLLVEAADEVDLTLLETARAASVGERLDNAFNMARNLARLRNAASQRR